MWVQMHGSCQQGKNRWHKKEGIGKAEQGTKCK